MRIAMTRRSLAAQVLARGTTCRVLHDGGVWRGRLDRRPARSIGAAAARRVDRAALLSRVDVAHRRRRACVRAGGVPLVVSRGRERARGDGSRMCGSGARDELVRFAALAVAMLASAIAIVKRAWGVLSGGCSSVLLATGLSLIRTRASFSRRRRAHLLRQIIPVLVARARSDHDIGGRGSSSSHPFRIGESEGLMASWKRKPRCVRPSTADEHRRMLLPHSAHAGSRSDCRRRRLVLARCGSVPSRIRAAQRSSTRLDPVAFAFLSLLCRAPPPNGGRFASCCGSSDMVNSRALRNVGPIRDVSAAMALVISFVPGVAWVWELASSSASPTASRRSAPHRIQPRPFRTAWNGG